MEKLLEEAIKKVSLLPDKDKKAFAAFIIEELEHEERWQDLFEKSRSQLESLANEALEAYKSGDIKPLDPESL